MNISSRLLLVAFVFLALAPFSRALGDGPTPYPDPEDTNAWPGVGPIRVFPYMADNRKSFWARRAQANDSVVFVGDSLMEGYKVKEAFPDLQVANRAIGGEVTRGVLFRLKEDVIDINPQAVVLCIGSNDLSSHANPAGVAGNIEEIIRQLREANGKLPIVLLLVPPRDVDDAPLKPGALADLNEKIRQLGGGQENIEVVDIFTPMADDMGMPLPDLFDSRKIHPTPAGYAKWTELIAPALAKLGVK